METINVETKKRCDFIDITSSVEAVVRKDKTESGICVVFCAHTTAGLTINENADPAVTADMADHLNKVVPPNKGYSHAEGNADSHIKTSLIGPSLNIIVENNKLVLGTWQGIYFCEFDGPRSRKVYVKVMKDKG